MSQKVCQPKTDVLPSCYAPILSPFRKLMKIILHIVLSLGNINDGHVCLSVCLSVCMSVCLYVVSGLSSKSPHFPLPFLHHGTLYLLIYILYLTALFLRNNSGAIRLDWPLTFSRFFFVLYQFFIISLATVLLLHLCS